MPLFLCALFLGSPQPGLATGIDLLVIKQQAIDATIEKINSKFRAIEKNDDLCTGYSAQTNGKLDSFREQLSNYQTFIDGKVAQLKLNLALPDSSQGVDACNGAKTVLIKDLKKKIVPINNANTAIQTQVIDDLSATRKKLYSENVPGCSKGTIHKCLMWAMEKDDAHPSCRTGVLANYKTIADGKNPLLTQLAEQLNDLSTYLQTRSQEITANIAQVNAISCVSDVQTSPVAKTQTARQK